MTAPFSLRSWLLAHNPQCVPLFAANDTLEVSTWTKAGPATKRYLCRSQMMEEAIVAMVQAGMPDPAWTGLLYIMGWGDLPGFRPLYVGKAGKKGVRNPISANIKNQGQVEVRPVG